MSIGMVRQLSQLSLLDERDGRIGFRDLASARQIAKLLNDGVRLSEIIRAVSKIRKWLPDAGLPAVRLHADALSDVQVEQPGGRTDKYGQFVLAVDGARDDPDDLAAAHAPKRRSFQARARSRGAQAAAVLSLDHGANFGAKGVEGEGFRQHVHSRLEKPASKRRVLGVSAYEKYF